MARCEELVSPGVQRWKADSVVSKLSSWGTHLRHARRIVDEEGAVSQTSQRSWNAAPSSASPTLLFERRLTRLPTSDHPGTTRPRLF